MSRGEDLIKKAQTEKLSDEEQKELLSALGQEIEELKKNKPEKYLELLKDLNAAISEANKALS